MLSSKVTNDSHGQHSSYFLGWQEYEKNPYHDLHNPTGIIQMGLAENQLSIDLLESWLAKNPAAAGFERNGESVFKQLALFQDYHGLPAFKKELAGFMAMLRGNKAKFDPNNLVLTAGSTSANETLMFCLANPGEAFLVPTPYYPGFDRDIQWRTGVKIVKIHSSSINGFRITKSALEQAYNRAQMLSLKVKGVLITNPSNPLGTTMSLNELNLLIDFSIARNLHIVSDEIFSGTVFDSPNFISIMEVIKGRKFKEIVDRVHIVYSLSKDLGIPGFRVGMIYSKNETVVSAATKMSSFGLISSQTQYLLSNMLSDKKFINKYINITRKRLEKRKEMLVMGFQHAGIRCLKSNAGLFCWVDMRHLLPSNSFEAETKLWKTILHDVGLNISAGSSCHCSEPGWFRICFANIPEKTLNLAMQRVKGFVQFSGWRFQNRYIDNNQQPVISDSWRKNFMTKWIFKVASGDGDHETEDR